MKITRRISGTVCCILLAISPVSPKVGKGNSSPTDCDFVGTLDNVSQDHSPLYTVGRNVQISLPNSDIMHYEVAGCVNPDDPNLMLVSSMSFNEDGNASTYLYRSTDHGQTWSLVLAPKDIVSDGDPTCIFGPNNKAYYVTFSQLADRHRYILVYRSSDNGKTWSRSEPQIGIDRPYLTIDRTGGPNNGTIYCTGKGFITAYESEGGGGLKAVNAYICTAAVILSRDGGRTIEGPFQRGVFSPEYLLSPGQSVILGDGTVVTSFSVLKDRLATDRIGSMSGAKLESIRFVGGGKWFDTATTIAEWSRSWQTGSLIPMMSVDPGSPAFKDRIYSVRIDDQSGRSRVLLSYSSDRGRTWSRSRIVDDDVSQSDIQQAANATNPSVAVNRQGVVAVGWADRRDSSDNLGWWYRMSLSFDGGETFLPSFKVASAGHLLESGDMPLFTFVNPSKNDEPKGGSISIHPWHFGGGHTCDMLVDPHGVFYPVWVDNRTGIPQVWTTPVTVRGAATVGGSDSLATLSDVTPNVSIEYLRKRYDYATKTIHLTVRLKNTSSKVVYSSAKLRIISMTSDLGDLAAVHPAVYQPTGGVVWDLSPSLKDGKLRPGDASESTELVLQLTHPKRPGQATGYKFGLCNLETRVFASLKE